MAATAVVIPVKDGERWLAEVLDAVRREDPDELLVIDSGSSDGSAAIARAAGASVLEIPAAEFGHGRTRNLALEHTSGDLIAFITQDATPVPGWLAAYVEALALDDRVAAAFGPHLPRPDTSPMIARELTEFFAAFSPDGGPAIQRGLDDGSAHPGFLSNANAAYRRTALQEIRFRDVAYAEDQAFARDLFEAGWLKAYHPDAAVLHAHDYPWGDFMRRYFDEYRGLHETTGHVEPIGVRSTARAVRDEVARDRAFLDARGVHGAERAVWTARSAAHHGGRRVFSALGSRADRLPEPARRALSLEGRGDGGADHPPALRHVPPRRPREQHAEILDFEHRGAAALLPVLPGLAERTPLHVAIVIPPFRTGSGGHDTIFRIFAEIERLGHTCSVWIVDPIGEMSHERPSVIRERIRSEFAPLNAPVHVGFDDWFGADVALATGWQTVFPVLQLGATRARAYFVQDHEPEFYGSGTEARWAQETYTKGLHAICASPWLADIVTGRYGGTASVFQLGQDPTVYHPRPVPRRRDTIVFYGRAVTPRRAVPLGMLALAELYRRRPDTRIVIYGDPQPPAASFPFEHAGVASQEHLALLYSEATVGLCLSMTNYSRVPAEMLACGLPCVDLEGYSAESVFGEDGPVELSAFSAMELAGHMERLMDDEVLWQRRSDAGRAFVAAHTWESAAVEVEAGLREALLVRERASVA
ncbi:MAG TPA: glycosyltransferase [Solirubrobacteraceae bacterium]|nr:glycosyltransferase [Solirubrobacteraceae bacterium]